jgi:hypothetical protein
LNAVHGPNCAGRFPPTSSRVKPKTRPMPLKICTCIYDPPRCTHRMIGPIGPRIKKCHGARATYGWLVSNDG